MFKRIIYDLITKIIKYPKIVIILTTLLSILLISGIGFIESDDDLKRLLPEDMPSIVTFNQIEDEFGNFEFMYVAIGNSGESIFKPDLFNIAWNLSNDIKFRLKNARKLDRKSLNLLRNQEIHAIIN